MTDPNSPQNKLAWSNINIGFDVDKDLAGKYDLVSDEISFNSNFDNIEIEESKDVVMPKSVTIENERLEI